MTDLKKQFRKIKILVLWRPNSLKKMVKKNLRGGMQSIAENKT